MNDVNEILIIGYGVVGHNLEKELSSLNPDHYDKYKKDNTKIEEIPNIDGWIESIKSFMKEYEEIK